MTLLANSALGHVIPAKAGIQTLANMLYVYIEGLHDGLIAYLDSSFRWNDMLKYLLIIAFYINVGKEQLY